MSEKQMSGGEWPRELSLDNQLGPAPYITRAKADALILGALQEAGFASVPIPAAAVEAPPVRRRPRFALRSSAAAAVLVACMGVGSASAAVMWYVRQHVSPAIEPSQVAAPAPVRRARRQAAPMPPPAPLAPTETVETRHKVEARAPEDWLEEGNRLRADKRWRKADEAYSHALRSSSRSQTAYVARVASAAVRLEHLGDARGALALYSAALRQTPAGPLSEEIRFGIAEAYRQLGDRDAERRALEVFLRQHPGSPLAEQARARLE